MTNEMLEKVRDFANRVIDADRSAMGEMPSHLADMAKDVLAALSADPSNYRRPAEPPAEPAVDEANFQLRRLNKMVEKLGEPRAERRRFTVYTSDLIELSQEEQANWPSSVTVEVVTAG